MAQLILQYNFGFDINSYCIGNTVRVTQMNLGCNQKTRLHFANVKRNRSLFSNFESRNESSKNIGFSFVVAIGCVRFAKYCGKIYSRHPFWCGQLHLKRSFSLKCNNHLHVLPYIDNTLFG